MYALEAYVCNNVLNALLRKVLGENKLKIILAFIK